MDQVDRKILNLLQENSKITIKELSAKLNLSTTPIFERIKRLEKEGVISNYVAILDKDKIGKKLTAFIHISLSNHTRDAVDEFARVVIQHDEVKACYHVTGSSDFLLKIMVEDMEAYNTYIQDKLAVAPYLGKVESRFSLSARKDTHMFRL
ncbi:MAG: Lrp/AsnC family transcriptional regulator [Bacteroidia bacterium]|nr:Lrp/AsnC family transcriptional regulator [Bacteroidia bacterium]